MFTIITRLFTEESAGNLLVAPNIFSHHGTPVLGFYGAFFFKVLGGEWEVKILVSNVSVNSCTTNVPPSL